MQKFKGTSGEWSVSPHPRVIKNEQDVPLGEAYFNVPLTEVYANARLWAASKDLLEALQAAVDDATEKAMASAAAADIHNNTPGVGQKFDYISSTPPPKWVDKARVAIAKALVFSLVIVLASCHKEIHRPARPIMHWGGPGNDVRDSIRHVTA